MPQHTPKRADSRLVARIPLVLLLPQVRIPVLTENISYRGLLVRPRDTRDAIQLLSLPPRAFVRLSLDLSTDSAPLELCGMIIHGPTHQQELSERGIGIQLYGNDKTLLAQWNALIGEAASVLPVSKGGVKAEVHQEIPGGSNQRAHQRFAAVLVVRWSSGTDIITMLSRDLSKGGMFLVTDRPFDLGTPLLLAIYPAGGTRPVEIESVVRRVADEPGAWGIGVEFVGLDEQRRADLFRKLLPRKPCFVM